MSYKENNLMIDDTMYAPGGLLDQFMALSPEEQDRFLLELRKKEKESIANPVQGVAVAS